MESDFVCVGDATQDNFFFISDAEVQCDLNRENCELILRYGQKIGVEEIGVSVGGNAANVATGLSRLGLRTKFLTTFGDDERGAWIKREMMRTGVDIESSSTDRNRASNMSGIIVFKGERTILTYHCEGPDLVKGFPGSKWLYLTSSSGRDTGELHKKVIAYKKGRPSLRVAFNPSISDLKQGKAFLEPVLAVTDVLILNRVEAETLLGDGEGGVARVEKVKEMLAQISGFGPKTLAITDSEEGAYAYSRGLAVFCSVASGFVLKETTGAGDAFSSGFLAGLFLNNMDVERAILWGQVNAGSVISKVGGQAGLLSKTEIETYLLAHPDFRARKV